MGILYAHLKLVSLMVQVSYQEGEIVVYAMTVKSRSCYNDQKLIQCFHNFLTCTPAFSTFLSCEQIFVSCFVLSLLLL